MAFRIYKGDNHTPNSVFFIAHTPYLYGRGLWECRKTRRFPL
ncbi:hypothetical protein [Moraxella phage Mcat4]|nr:hypothetical protein [Moraxella phage Mcat4]